MFGLIMFCGKQNGCTFKCSQADISRLDCQSLKNPRMVEILQEKAHCSLKRHVERTNPQNPERFAKILLRLPATKNLSPESIEQIFFAPLIGTVRIENIMANIMNNSVTF